MATYLLYGVRGLDFWASGTQFSKFYLVGSLVNIVSGTIENFVRTDHKGVQFYE